MAPISQHTLSGRERVLCVYAMKQSISEKCRSDSSTNTRQEKRVNHYLIRSKLIDSDCVLVLIKREICQVD